MRSSQACEYVLSNDLESIDVVRVGDLNIETSGRSMPRSLRGGQSPAPYTGLCAITDITTTSWSSTYI